MYNKEIPSVVSIEEIFRTAFNYKSSPNFVIHVGAGGYDLFSEVIDKEAGYERIYLSKIPRILKGHFRKNLSGKYYKRVKIK